MPLDLLVVHVTMAGALVEQMCWFLGREPCGEAILQEAEDVAARLIRLRDAIRARPRSGPTVLCDCGARLLTFDFDEDLETWRAFCVRCEALLVVTPAGTIVRRRSLPSGISADRQAKERFYRALDEVTALLDRRKDAEEPG